MALFAITFSGGNVIVLFRFALGLNSLERNVIVLFRFALGLKAQKRLARAERKRRPELMCQIILPCRGKIVTSLLLRNAIFPELSNKICTIKAKSYIFAS